MAAVARPGFTQSVDVWYITSCDK